MFAVQYLFDGEWKQAHLSIWNKNWEKGREPAIYSNLPSAVAALDYFREQYPNLQFRTISQSLVLV